jgi:hypothetical protein
MNLFAFFSSFYFYLFLSFVFLISSFIRSFICFFLPSSIFIVCLIPQFYLSFLPLFTFCLRSFHFSPIFTLSYAYWSASFPSFLRSAVFSVPCLLFPSSGPRVRVVTDGQTDAPPKETYRLLEKGLAIAKDAEWATTASGERCTATPRGRFAAG